MATNGIEKRQGKGRKKTGTERIGSVLNRQITLTKRRQGLKKKAYELSVLTGAEIAVIVYTPNKKVYSFGSPHDVDHVVDKYLMGNNPPISYMRLLMECMPDDRIKGKNLELRTFEDDYELQKKRNQELEQKLLEWHAVGQNISQLKQSMLIMNQLKQSVLEMKNLKFDSQGEINASGARFPSMMGLNINEPGQGIRNSRSVWDEIPPFQVGLNGYGTGAKESGWFSNSYGDGGVFPDFGFAGNGNNGITSGFSNTYENGGNGNVGSSEGGGVFSGYGGSDIFSGFGVAGNGNNGITSGFSNAYGGCGVFSGFGVAGNNNNRITSGFSNTCENGYNGNVGSSEGSGVFFGYGGGGVFSGFGVAGNGNNGITSGFYNAYGGGGVFSGFGVAGNSNNGITSGFSNTFGNDGNGNVGNSRSAGVFNESGGMLFSDARGYLGGGQFNESSGMVIVDCGLGSTKVVGSSGADA